MDEEYRRETPSQAEGGRSPSGACEGGGFDLGGLLGRSRGPSLKIQKQLRTTHLTAEQRLLILDTWQRSGLPAKDFAGIVGVSTQTLSDWKRRFEREGPEGLIFNRSKKRGSSRLPELTKRTILMIKQANPDFGCRRISAMLERGPGLAASANAVSRVLHEAGYELENQPTKRHPDKPRRFERPVVNQLWQTDLFSFILKRQNRRVHLVVYMDDHSRYIVGHGLHMSPSAGMVIEVLRGAIASYGVPVELLTDNGPQYNPWRAKGEFTRECEKQGIRQLVARPRRPQTLGKVERFWKTLWRELLEQAIFIDLGEARERIGHYIDHYNFQRPHQGIDNLVPADRYFSAAEEVKQTLAARVSANSLSLAQNGVPQEEFYLTGQVGGKPVSVWAEDGRLIVRGEKITHEADPAPGTSGLDEGLKKISETLQTDYNEETDHGGDNGTQISGSGNPVSDGSPGRAETGAHEPGSQRASGDRAGSAGWYPAGERSLGASADQCTGVLQPGSACAAGPGQGLREPGQGSGHKLPPTDPGAGRAEPETGAGSAAVPEPDQSGAESDRPDGNPSGEQDLGHWNRQEAQETYAQESPRAESGGASAWENTQKEQSENHTEPAESRLPVKEE